MVNVLGKEEIVEALGNESKELANFFSNNFGEGYYIWFNRVDLGGEENEEGLFDIYNLLGSPVYEVEDKKIAIQIDGEVRKVDINNCLTYLNREGDWSKAIIILKLKVK